MKKLFTSITVFAFAALLFMVQSANADCTAIYGGGQSCPPSYNFIIEKLVQTPGKGGGNFVDMLSVNDPKYSPKNDVAFQLIVRNTGNQTIPNLTVSDKLPDYLTFVSLKKDKKDVPVDYNKGDRRITFNIANLGTGQDQTFILVGRLSDANMMPSDQATICLINHSSVTDNSTQDSDSSQFCVQKQVLGKVFPAPKIEKQPSTGPEMLPLALLLPGALAGFILRKRTQTLKGGEK